MKNLLIGTGVVALILFVVVLVIGFQVASVLLTVALYVVAAIFLIILVVYLYRKSKNTLSGSDD